MDQKQAEALVGKEITVRLKDGAIDSIDRSPLPTELTGKVVYAKLLRFAIKPEGSRERSVAYADVIEVVEPNEAVYEYGDEE